MLKLSEHVEYSVAPAVQAGHSLSQNWPFFSLGIMTSSLLSALISLSEQAITLF